MTEEEFKIEWSKLTEIVRNIQNINDRIIISRLLYAACYEPPVKSSALLSEFCTSENLDGIEKTLDFEKIPFVIFEDFI